jgi:hypothetical protein
VCDSTSILGKDALRTSSKTLQQKLDELALLSKNNDRESFVAAFVPLDLTPADSQGYLDDLTKGPESVGQWANLAAEIAAIAEGNGVQKISGDQVSEAVFFLSHPLLEKCDREVAFRCVGGEWRAEG